MTALLERRHGVTATSVQQTAHAQRHDIQGLRAVAVTIVVAYHAGLPFVPGGFVGVDLFFVLSGFLITQLLLREIAATGTVSLRQFWARRARRIMPVSALVLVSTMLAVRAFMSPLDREAIGTDIRWSALFSGNWRFAQQQTDYLASDRNPSPVLHYWSLGVEEQFYVAWPLLLIGLAVVWRLARRRRAAHALTFGGAFAAVILVSLAYCVHTTATNQPYAFFGTPARAWQLAAGALTALAVPAVLRWRSRIRAAVGAAGLVLFGLSVYALDESGSAGLGYPSWLAIAPTLAGVLLIASGTGPYSRLNRLLSIRPLTYVGDISFSLYLWHWPVLIIGMEAIGARTPLVRLALVAIAVGLSVASYHLVENPLRRAHVLVRRPTLSLAVGAVLVSAVVPIAAYASETGTIDRIRVPPVSSSADAQDQSAALQRVTPALDKAASDAGPFKQIGCHVGFKQTTTPSWDACTFADKHATHSVLVLGDSISGAIAPGVIAAGQQRGWAVTVWAKSECPMADVTKFDPALGGDYVACNAFRDAALRAVETHRPDVVVLAMSRMTTDKLTVHGKQVVEQDAVRQATLGLEHTVHRLRAAGVGVVLSDSPNRAPFFPTSCLAKQRDVRDCEFAVNQKTSIMTTTSRAMGDQVALVKANATACPKDTCYPVVGNVVVYQDKLHFTQTFAKTLASRFAAGILRAASSVSPAGRPQ